jgi:hypothetical protein
MSRTIAPSLSRSALHARATAMHTYPQRMPPKSLTGRHPHCSRSVQNDSSLVVCIAAQTSTDQRVTLEMRQTLGSPA